MPRTITAVVAAAALCVAAVGLARTQRKQVRGTYQLQGAAPPEGAKYDGMVTFKKHPRSRGHLALTRSIDGEKISGVGLIRGNALGAAFGGSSRGVGYYEEASGIDPIRGVFVEGKRVRDGGMPDHGLATIEGDDDDPWAGVHEASRQEFGDGFTVTVVKVAEHRYDLTWEWSDGTTVRGIGLARRGRLWVAWGEGDVALAVYALSKGGKHLEGDWARPGVEGLGFERLAR